VHLVEVITTTLCCCSVTGMSVEMMFDTSRVDMCTQQWNHTHGRWQHVQSDIGQDPMDWVTVAARWHFNLRQWAAITSLQWHQQQCIGLGYRHNVY